MIESSQVPWGRMVGTATGSALAGPAGALVGNLAGGLLQSFLPGAAGVAAILGAIVSKTLEAGSDTLIAQWAQPEKQQINHDLQAAFRDALVEALYDIGGKTCFSSQWRDPRDVPVQTGYPITTLQRQDAALAGQVCLLFQRMVEAVKGQQILPIEPPADQPAASVVPYLQVETPEELNKAFLAQVITPYLQREGGLPLLDELRRLGFDLEAHLRRRLLDRTLVHLGEFLKARTPAWRAFNRLILENLRTQLQGMSVERESQFSAEQLSQVEVELAQVRQLLQTSSLAADLADWLSAVGRVEKRLDEGFDSLFRRIAQDHNETVERLHSLLGLTGRIDAKMDRVLLLLENGQWEVIGTPSAPVDEPPEPGESPFMGLQYFTEADAHLFFGREHLTARLVSRLRQHRFLAVVGTSGSGKSSVVRAGLIPALRRGKPLADGTLPPAGSTDWPIHVITPTAHPLEVLAATLTRDSHSLNETTHLLEDLAREPRSLYLHARKLFSRRDHEARPHGRLLLVVDQFEELFTLCRNEQERSSFVDNLLAAVESSVEPNGVPEPEGPVAVVIVLRADFYAHCAQYEGLRNALVHHQDFIGPMNEEELRRAIEEPAKQGGWKFERGVVELLLRDVGNEPGALPLLSHALLETWKRRRGRTMVLESYAESGMVRGAIAQTAEYVFNQQLTPEQRPLARNIFLRLTELGESTEDSRRRVALDELLSTGEHTESIQSILRSLVDARLVTAGEGTVELAHEALIREWPTLREWLAENREWLRIHRHLTEAAEEWEALQRDPGELYRGARLLQVMEWAKAHSTDLNTLERAFLEASRDASLMAEREKEQARQQELEHERALTREAEARRQAEAQHAKEAEARARQERKAAQRLRWLALALAALFLVALGGGWYISQQNNQLQTQLNTIDSQRLAFAAESQVDTAPERALLLAYEAVTRHHDVQSEQILRDIMEATTWWPIYFNGHQAPVRSAIFSPNGEQILTASDDGTARLWDLNGQTLAVFEGHEDQVTSATFSPDGQRILTASDDGTARLWDGDGQILATLAGHSDAVSTASFSSDGRLILTASDDGTARLWESNGQSLAVLEGHTDTVVSAVFSSDNKFALTASSDGTARLWDLTGQVLTVFEGHEDELTDAVFSPDGQSILTASLDRTARLWDRQGQLHAVLQHAEYVTKVLFSLDGDRLFTADDRGNSIQMWDSSGQHLGTFYGHTRPVNEITLSPDGQYILTASDDGTARLWNQEGLSLVSLRGDNLGLSTAVFSPDGKSILTSSINHTAALWHETGPPLPSLRGHDDEVESVAFSSNGQQILTASSDGTARLWDVSGQPLVIYEGHEEAVENAVFGSDEQQVLTVSDDGTVRLWDINGELIQAFAGHTDEVGSAVFSPDGQHILTASDDKTARLWNQAGETVTIYEGHTADVESATFSPDGELVLTASEDGTAILWQLNGERQALFEGHSGELKDAIFSPDGAYVLTASDDDTARLWNREGETLAVLEGHTADIERAIFSPDGRQVLTTSWDHTARLWDLQGTLRAAFNGHTNVVKWAAFSPDGQRIVTASDDGTARLWSLTGQPITVLHGHDNWVASAIFSPDGRQIATASRDYTVRQYLTHLDDILAVASCQVGRGLTPEEVEQFGVGSPHFVYAQRRCPPDLHRQE